MIPVSGSNTMVLVKSAQNWSPNRPKFNPPLLKQEHQNQNQASIRDLQRPRFLSKVLNL